MYRVELAPEAELDLDIIYDSIADAGSPDTAAAFTDRIAAACLSMFRVFPHRGRQRPELSPGLRHIGFERTVNIFFRVSDTHHLVTVLRILRKGQDDQKVFAPTELSVE